MGSSYEEGIRKGTVYSPSHHPPAGTYAAQERDRLEAERKKAKAQREADAEWVRQKQADLESQRQADRAREKRAAARAQRPTTAATTRNAPPRTPVSATPTKAKRTSNASRLPAKAPALLVLCVAIVLAGTVWHMTSSPAMDLEWRLPITIASCVFAPLLARWIALVVFATLQVIKWTIVLSVLAGFGYMVVILIR